MQNLTFFQTQWRRVVQACVLAGVALTSNFASANPSTQVKQLPDFVKSSLDFRSLANGDWLVLDKKKHYVYYHQRAWNVRI